MPLKNCYVEVKAQFLLEKDNTQRLVTTFAKVLNTLLNEDVYEYKNKGDELTEKLLFLNNSKLVQSGSKTNQEDIYNIFQTSCNSNNKTWLTNHWGQPELLYVAKWNLRIAKIETMLASNFLSCLAWAGPRWSAWASRDSQMHFACLLAVTRKVIF